MFAALKTTYSHRNDLILVNAALAPQDGSIALHRVRPSNANEPWVTGTASLQPDKLDTIRSQVKNLDDVRETINVRAVRLKRFTVNMESVGSTCFRSILRDSTMK